MKIAGDVLSDLEIVSAIMTVYTLSWIIKISLSIRTERGGVKDLARSCEINKARIFYSCKRINTCT